MGDLMVAVSGRVDRLPRPGENLVLREPAVHATGVAANIALNLRGLGAAAHVAGAVGRDALGDFVLGELRSAGVGIELVERSGEPTATFVFMIEPNGERTMVGARGAAERFDLEPAALSATRPSWVHISGHPLLDPAMAERCDRLAGAAEALGIRCSVGLDGVAAGGFRSPLDRLTVLCNLDEYRAYFGHPEPTPQGRSAPVVVKAGARGCFVVTGDRVDAVAAAPAAVVDTTGAGDAFDAAFIAANLRGLDVRTAARWGNAAAALKVGRPGPRAAWSAADVDHVLAGGGR